MATPTKATEKIYSKYKNLLYKESLRIYRKNPSLEFDDILGQANLIFCKACDTFDETKGCKFITHLCNQLLALKSMLSSTYSVDESGNQYLNLSFESMQNQDSENTGTWEPVEASAEYSKKQEDCSSNWEDRIGDFKQYFDKLGDDERQMIYDILDGKINPSASSRAGMGRKAYLKSVSNMTPITMYVRHYRNIPGWNVQKVAAVKARVANILRQWQHDLEPMSTNCPVEELFLF